MIALGFKGLVGEICYFCAGFVIQRLRVGNYYSLFKDLAQGFCYDISLYVFSGP